VYFSSGGDDSGKWQRLARNRIAFTSPGKLHGNLTVEDRKRDDYVSFIRNKLLADAFYLTGDIERYGTGFVRIRRWLKDYPEIRMELGEISDSFRVGLLSPALEEWSADQEKEGGKPEKLPEKLPELPRLIIEQMPANLKVTYLQLSRVTGKSKEAIRKNTQRLRRMGLIRRIGPAKGRHWQVALGGE